jgi:hypothetical protein
MEVENSHLQIHKEQIQHDFLCTILVALHAILSKDFEPKVELLLAMCPLVGGKQTDFP